MDFSTQYASMQSVQWRDLRLTFIVIRIFIGGFVGLRLLEKECSLECKEIKGKVGRDFFSMVLLDSVDKVVATM